MSQYLDQLDPKTSLVDADQFVIIDSQDSNNNKRVTKAVMATVFGGGGGGSSELITNALIYTGSDIELNVADWKDIQSMNLQAGKYLILAMAGCKRTVTTAQVWQLRIQNATSNTTLSSANDNTPSNTTQFSQLNCWAIVELTAENTTIKTQARATTTSASYITKDTQTPVGNATQLIAIKLDGISGGSYTLPVASETTLGGVKTDMNHGGIYVTGTGVIKLVDDLFGEIEILYDGTERLFFRIINGSVTEDKLSLDDVTTGNTDTSRHGYMPKLSGANNQTINGSGTWKDCMINLEYLDNKDIDDTAYAVESGYRYVAANCTNTPVAGQDYLLVTYFAQDYGYQYAYTLDINNPKVYIRYYDDTGNVYSAWTELGSGGSLPTDNWLLGNGSIDLYNALSLHNIINGESIDFQSEMYNNRINGTNISDNGAGNPMVNNSVNGDNIIIKDVNNSSIVGKEINVEKVNSSIVSGRNHNIGLQPDSTDVRNVKVSGLGVNNAWHSNAEYLASGNTGSDNIFQNTKFTGKSSYTIIDGQASREDYYINVGGLLDPTLILLDPTVQFVSIDLHITYILSKSGKDNREQLSFTTIKSLLLVDIYRDEYAYNVLGSNAMGINVVADFPFITGLRGIVWNNNMGYLQLMGTISPIEFYQQASEDPTGYILETYITAEMHTIKNDVMYERS